LLKRSFQKTSLCLSFATSKTFPNNIINNDSGHTHLWIHDAWNEDTGEQVRPFTLDSTMYGYSNYKNGYKNKCKFKKINKGADWAKIEKALISYFTEMKTAIETDKGGRG